ncbi:uncharacterized protein LOC113360071 [Papaver somniferum]|uniref:uncharacterized protein LOC113360071 n=1 Tax=Papaver somniferum TaxID=3469 RepID=UPI000E6F8C93|nr:uncharacterized protein LOC113360071 [Papaver somniferum]
MPALSLDFQGAFIHDKQILDGVLIANKCVDSRLKSKKPGILCKIDMEKAFDIVNWNFLFIILQRHDFGEKWISWIRWCVTSSHLSILVNGSSTEKFKPTKGLREGDSLSPYLFLLVVEILSKLLNDAVERGQLSGFQVVENGSIISHLQLTYDTLVFIDASAEEVRRLLIILEVFETLTGLKLNFDKSTMISVGADEVTDILARELGCKTEKLSFTYLRMPIGSHWRNVSVWEHVLVRIEQRLATWKKIKLNKAGRLVFIKSGLASLPIYYLSLFHLPVSVEKKMVRIMRNFFWGYVEGRRKMVWVGWLKICKPEESRGLGVKNLRNKNRSMPIKWIWRFERNRNCLWRRIVNQKFKRNNDVLVPDVDSQPQCRSF